MIRPPPRSTRTDTLGPYTTLYRAIGGGLSTHRRKSADIVVHAMDIHPCREQVGILAQRECREVSAIRTTVYADAAGIDLRLRRQPFACCFDVLVLGSAVPAGEQGFMEVETVTDTEPVID